MTGDPVVVVPGDLDVEDRLVGPVTFRMAAWLAAAAAGIALIAASGGAAAPTVLGVVLAMVGIAGAFWRPGDRPVGAWLAPLIAYRGRQHGRGVGDAAESVPDVEPVPQVEAQRATPRRSSRVPRPRLVAAVVGVALVGAVAFGQSRRFGSPQSPAAPAPVAVPDPAVPSGGPVIVVVPVDPFSGWGVDGGGLLDPWCGC